MKFRSGVFVLALFMASLNLRPGISCISPILTILSDNLGMNAAVASLLTSIPVLCMGLFSPIVVRVGTRLGIERVLTGSLILIAFATFLRVFTTTSWFLLFTAFLIGVGIAATGPLLSGFIKHHFPSRVSAMIGVYSVAMTIGAAAAAGLTIPLLQGFHGSWRLATGIWMVLAVMALPVWFAALRHPDVSHKNETSGQHVPLPWTTGRAWFLTVFFGLMAFLFYCFIAWIPPMVSAKGWSTVFSGAVATVFTLVQIPSTLFIPLLMHRYPSRKFWLLFCSALELVGLLMLTFTNVNPMVAAIFMGLGAGGLFPVTLILPIDQTSNGKQATAWSAMVQSIGYIIGAAGPFIIGAMHDATHGFTRSLELLIAIVLIMFAMEFIVARSSHSEGHETS